MLAISDAMRADMMEHCSTMPVTVSGDMVTIVTAADSGIGIYAWGNGGGVAASTMRVSATLRFVRLPISLHRFVAAIRSLRMTG